jgi:hypothetical protein
LAEKQSETLFIIPDSFAAGPNKHVFNCLGIENLRTQLQGMEGFPDQLFCINACRTPAEWTITSGDEVVMVGTLGLPRTRKLAQARFFAADELELAPVEGTSLKGFSNGFAEAVINCIAQEAWPPRATDWQLRLHKEWPATRSDGIRGPFKRPSEASLEIHRLRVFVSYVREDQDVVDRLGKELNAYGINVWLDKTQLGPGYRWKDEIRKAISEGDFFIACFSEAYERRAKSYMNEELTLAIEELRQRPAERAWFIPVLLSKCEVPARSIGAGETLRDIQWVEFYRNWEEGIDRIAAVMRKLSG